MSKNSSANEMLQRSIAAITDDGKLSVDELNHIVEAGLEDGVLDAEEKQMLFRIISRLNAGDFTPELWARVEQLIGQYDLDGED